MNDRLSIGQRPNVWQRIAAKFRQVVHGMLWRCGLRSGLMRGELVLELFGPDGQLKDSRAVANTITTNGRNQYAEQLLAAPSAGTKTTHMTVGTSTPGVNALGAEVAASRVALTSKTRSTNVVTHVGDFAAGVGTGALIEAGLFDTASAGNMTQSTTFSAINKAAADTLKITWTLTVG